MKANQVVTISFFRFSKFRKKYWAFTMMQLAHSKISKQSEGLSFYKLLGSGADNGFGAKPNFGVYGLLGVWENEEMAQRFMAESSIYKRYSNYANESFYCVLKPIMSHGSWSGQQPFEVCEDKDTSAGKIAVLTRATIKPAKVFSFWRNVAGVGHTATEAKGRNFSIGIGEWPWLQQATFSIWDGEKEMKDFAYNSPMHREVIKMTREKGWYQEELFARFRLLKVCGEWEGKEVKF